jgi:hypothetical protein
MLAGKPSKKNVEVLRGLAFKNKENNKATAATDTVIGGQNVVVI